MKGEIYDKKEIYDQLNKDVYFKDGGSMNLASLAGSIEKIRSKSKSSGNGSDSSDSPNVTKRFDAQYVRGEDNIGADHVGLGDFTPDIQYQDLKAGDIIDIPPKEEDITNVIFRNNGTESIHTQVYYASQDTDNFVPGNSYHCIRYERIADFPSDPNTQMSTLIFYKGWSSETGGPAEPYFAFRASSGETESGGTGLIPFVVFENGGSQPVILNPDSGYISFIEDESTSDFVCVEGVISSGVETSTPTFTLKRRDDGVASILDYYKFYYVANGKTYVMSRDGDYVRPLDITKSVVEGLREEVNALRNASVGPIILHVNPSSLPENRETERSSTEAAALLGCSEKDLDNICRLNFTAILNSTEANYARPVHLEINEVGIHNGEFTGIEMSLYYNDSEIYLAWDSTNGDVYFVAGPDQQ